MELEPRELSFVKQMMKEVAADESRQPTARVEAERIQKKAERKLTE
jgi:hypothetical protein